MCNSILSPTTTPQELLYGPLATFETNTCDKAHNYGRTSQQYTDFLTRIEQDDLIGTEICWGNPTDGGTCQCSSPSTLLGCSCSPVVTPSGSPSPSVQEQLVVLGESSSPLDSPRLKFRRRSRRKFDNGITVKGHKRQYVTHNYHDHANDDPGSSVELAMNALSPMRGGVLTPFPLRLHTMLERTDQEGLQTVVSWQPHGRAFVVHDVKRFVDHIMPRFFRQNKYSSFQRQLNLYGFMRLTKKGPDHGGYYHELFLRNRPFLCATMHRMRVKGTGIRTSASPETEPDFYKMPSVETSLGNHDNINITTDNINTINNNNNSLDASSNSSSSSNSIITPDMISEPSMSWHCNNNISDITGMNPLPSTMTTATTTTTTTTMTLDPMLVGAPEPPLLLRPDPASAAALAVVLAPPVTRHLDDLIISTILQEGGYYDSDPKVGMLPSDEHDLAMFLADLDFNAEIDFNINNNNNNNTQVEV